MRRRETVLTLAACVVLGGAPGVAMAQRGPGAAPAAVETNETKEQRDARMKWWREARFGMFIHWGVYSVPAGVYQGRPIGGLGEWIQNRARIPSAEYRKYVEQFNPTKFNAADIVKLARDAGMKYVVITSKHHDGCAMFKSTDNNHKSTETLIRNLCDIASKGGNYLLNIGPTAEGLVPQPHMERLLEMGRWLKVNGEAIYATGPNPFPRTAPTPPETPEAGRGRGRGASLPWDWRATTRLNPDGSGKIYLHIFQWPADGKFTVTSTYKAQLVKAYLLADPKTVIDGAVTIEGDQTTFSLKLPAAAPDPIAPVVCLEVKP